MAYLNVDAAKKRGFSDQEIAAYMKKKKLQAGGDAHFAKIQPKSVGGFVSNVGRDIGENIQGIAAIPGVLGQILTGKTSLGEVGGAVGKGVFNEYKDLVTNPVDTAYNKPVSTVLDVLPFLQVAKAGLVGKAGKASRAITSIDEAANASRTLSKGAKAARYTAPSLSEKTYLSNFVIPTKRAKDLRPLETARSMMKYGNSGSLEEIGNRAATITGNDGFVTKLQRKAIGDVGEEINISNALSSVKSSLGNIVDLTPNEERRLLASLNKSLPKGTSPDTANALDVFDKVKELEDIGHQYLNSSTYLTGNVKNEKIGQLYLDVAEELKNSIEGGIKSSKTVKGLITPEVLKQAKAISPKLAEDLAKAETLSDLREIQAPFVRIQKMIDLTNDSRLSSAQNLAGELKGVAQMIPSVSDPLAFLKPWLSSPEVNTNAAGALGTIGNIAETAGQAARNVGRGTRTAVTNPYSFLAGRQLDSLTPQTNQAEAATTAQGIPETQSTAESGIPIITPEILQRARIMLNESDYKKIKDIYDLQNSEGEKSEAQLVRETTRDLARDAYQFYLDNPDLDVGIVGSRKQQMLGKLGLADPRSLDFLTTIANLKAFIAKQRGGTSFTPSEERLLNRYTPNETDSKQQLETKLRKLVEAFNE